LLRSASTTLPSDIAGFGDAAVTRESGEDAYARLRLVR
jgi:hypothetical protein